jgi:hypothetical protein
MARYKYIDTQNALRSAAAHHTKCGRTGDVRQHGARLPHNASRCQQQRFVSANHYLCQRRTNGLVQEDSHTTSHRPYGA